MTLLVKTTHSAAMEAANDDDAWKLWFALHGPKLLLCARQWARSESDAEDIVQEAFVRFWRHQRVLGGEPLALVITSIRRVACDRARSDARRAYREVHAYETEGKGAPWFETPLEGEERRRLIEAALHRIPTEQREVLVLKIWGELTFAEIAAAVGASLNTVASRYRYALAALRNELSAANCHG